MERQSTFFDLDHERDMDLKRHSRRHDPATSHTAAAEMIDSGKLSAQCRAVLRVLKLYHHHTSAELARVGDLDRFMVARRLPDLERKGQAVRGAARKCRAHGSQAITWRAK